MSVYEIDDRDLNTLRVLQFKNANVDWLRYVAANRKGTVDDIYDVVTGPVANDQTMPVITLYLDGFLDEEDTIKRLLPQNLKDQYTFKTAEALSRLRFTEAIVL